MYNMEETSWGSRVVVGDDPLTEILTIDPGQMLKLKMHREMDKVFVPQATGLILFTQFCTPFGDYSPESKLMHSGNAYKVSKANKYRVINATAQPLKIVEYIDGKFNPDDTVVY